MLVYDNEEDIANIKINTEAAKKLDIAKINVTAPGADVDFVSRYFIPLEKRFEDPVTGSAHCALAPYWANRLGKKRLRAYQLSMRGGEIICELAGDRVRLIGSAITYSKGELILPA